MSFRIWLEQLRNVRGHRPLWPTLLGAALDAEFQRQRSIDESYKGDVFKNRDDHELDEGEKEERLVAKLYRSALGADGCLDIGSQRIWLLGFQWPTQGGVREVGRRADLVGMTVDGGLVVFEAKRADGDAPLIAITEGLDSASSRKTDRTARLELLQFSQIAMDGLPSSRAPANYGSQPRAWSTRSS